MDIKELLFQRPPHLWVGDVVDHSLSRIHTRTEVPADHPVLQGHFPGKPVCPGSILQEMSTQSAALLLTLHHATEEERHELAIGVLMHVQDAKYKAMVHPGHSCETKVELLSRASQAYRFKASVHRDDGALAARFQFTLANLPVEALNPA